MTFVKEQHVLAGLVLLLLAGLIFLALDLGLSNERGIVHQGRVTGRWMTPAKIYVETEIVDGMPRTRTRHEPARFQVFFEAPTTYGEISVNQATYEGFKVGDEINVYQKIGRITGWCYGPFHITYLAETLEAP